jgi:hypothetical protein
VADIAGAKRRKRLTEEHKAQLRESGKAHQPAKFDTCHIFRELISFFLKFYEKVGHLVKWETILMAMDG